MKGARAPAGKTMSFVSSASGRACLNVWDKSLSVSELFTLLADLKRTLAVAGGPAILIIVIREAVPAPADDMLRCMRATLPAIRAYCEELVFAVEGTSAEHALLRASLQSEGAEPGRHGPSHLFGTLSASLAHMQRFAPHDVLELKRHLLHREFPIGVS
jgi:hypothetical protein